MTFFLSFAGLVVLLYRLKPWTRTLRLAESSRTPMVSIIIPARNEEQTLPSLLRSLEELDYPGFEVIVVDDHSTDQTSAVARSFPNVRVLSAPVKPSDWAGKNWACWIGAGASTGELLLFTDADTIHHPHSLSLAVSYLEEKRSEMLSAPPSHLCPTRWEKCLGPFLLFPLIITAFREKPSPERLFAIGQYLLFTKTSYQALYGHAGVAGSLAEDVDLAHVWLAHGSPYTVYPHADLYSVRMFDSFRSFRAGWRRLLRLGLARSHVGSILEIAVLLHLITCGFGSGAVGLFCASVLVIAWTQRAFGEFSFWGAVLAPVNAVLFIALTLAAVWDRLLQRKIVWRDRSYPV